MLLLIWGQGEDVIIYQILYLTFHFEAIFNEIANTSMVKATFRINGLRRVPVLAEL